MRNMKTAILSGSVFILIVGISFLMFYVRFNKALITVRNNSNAEITEAEILMYMQKLGQGVFIGRVAEGQAITIKLPLKGENSIKLTYKDSLNQQHLSKEMYIEKSGGYHVFFIVTESQIITYEAHDWILPFF